MAAEEFEIYKLGDWQLQSGGILLDAKLAYKTFGDPKSPAIVYPTWFSGGLHSFDGSVRAFYVLIVILFEQYLINKQR